MKPNDTITALPSKREKRNRMWMCPLCMYERHEQTLQDCRRLDGFQRDYDKSVLKHGNALPAAIRCCEAAHAELVVMGSKNTELLQLLQKAIKCAE